jgi:sialidase-1
MIIGKVVLDLPPVEGNPRNSEGAFITLRDGTIMFIYSKFSGDKFNDDATADLSAIFSYDNGDTWKDEKTIIYNKEHMAINIMSVSLLRMNDGDIGLFYGVRKEENDARLHLRRSSDEGKTWSSPLLCMPPEGYYVVNNDRIVRLSNGRLIVPSAYHRNGYSSARKSVVNFDSRGEVIFFISDDDGLTWREGPSKNLLPFNKYSRSGLQEPGLIQLQNGVLWSWARTDVCYQYEMFSFDKGETWTAPQPSRFTSPCSPMSVKKIPECGNLLAVWNPIPNYNGRAEHSNKVWNGGRTPLVCAISEDDGNTWGNYKMIEDGQDHGYCYTAIHFVEDSVLLAYCAGGPSDGSCLSKLRIKKISLNEIL